MNICMVSYSLFESDTRILQYVEALRERGDTVDVLALRAAGFPHIEISSQLRVTRICSRRRPETGPLHHLLRILWFMFVAGVCLTWRCARKRYDVVHVHSVPDFLVFSALGAKLMGARLLLDIHDILPELYASKFHIPEQSFLYRMLLLCERWSAGLADHVIVANALWTERLAHRSSSPSKCTFIRNYPDLTLFRPREPVARPGCRILYPGSLNHHQGLDIAIRAFALVAVEEPGADLWIYGQGPELDNLVKLRDGLNLGTRIHFRGIVPVTQVAEVMAQADIAIVPKRASARFGNEAASGKIMEFMALGVPVVASRTQIEMAYFTDSEILFYDSEDEAALAHALLRLIRDPALRQALGAAGRRYALEHTWTDEKWRYLDLLGPAPTSSEPASPQRDGLRA